MKQKCRLINHQRPNSRKFFAAKVFTIRHALMVLVKPVGNKFVKRYSTLKLPVCNISKIAQGFYDISTKKQPMVNQWLNKHMAPFAYMIVTISRGGGKLV